MKSDLICWLKSLERDQSERFLEELRRELRKQIRKPSRSKLWMSREVLVRQKAKKLEIHGGALGLTEGATK